MSTKITKADSLLHGWLLRLVLPIGALQPSLVLLGAAASFFIAFGLTFCLVGFSPKSHVSQEPLPLTASLIPSVGLLSNL
ncbi:MAG: hypothetical protein VKO39_00150 [Cyanobacteriota bacterium]|nr:hypothetical protein [Cyanobacteriota bacterium]